MKRFILFLLIALGTSLFVETQAADIIVEENGVLPNFATIQAAVTAAQPGDRIFVKNKSGSVPYQENVTIDKPLSLLAWTSNGTFLVYGTYTLNPNGANFSSTLNTVSIIGMVNVSGSINATSNNTTGNRIYLNIVGNQLNSGSISLTGTNYFSEVAGNWLLGGSITTREATISGNLLNGNITVNASTTASEDTLYVVGNRLTDNVGSAYPGGIFWANANNYFHIANNHIKGNGNTGMFQVSAIKTGGGTNAFDNNSIEQSTSNAAPAIVITAALIPNCRLHINNNVCFDSYNGNDGSWTYPEYMLYCTNAQANSLVECHYNAFYGLESGFTNVSGTIISFVGNQAAPVGINPDDVTGVCSAAECINAGHPSTDYTDHDLSRNDRGVAGGSFNYNNFWPILTGGARVFLVKTPRTVVQASSINAEAAGYDR
ncbi:MAG: hypothetical protein H6581_03590 [Bacteroidia bacterium]|nr:hypothetical protein [Bacteroidia bacterium]